MCLDVNNIGGSYALGGQTERVLTSWETNPYFCFTGRNVQNSPDGWEPCYSLLRSGKTCGYLSYTTACPCGEQDPFKGRTAAPHRIKQWALAHAAHR